MIRACFMERTGMKGRLKISKAFVQEQQKVQFQRIEERLKIETRIYINLKKWPGTEIYTFLLNFQCLKYTLVAARASKYQMSSHPCRQHSLWKRDLQRELFLHILPQTYLTF